MDKVQECLEKCKETSYKVEHNICPKVEWLWNKADCSREYINDLQLQVDEGVAWTWDLESTMMCQVHCSHCPEGCNGSEISGWRPCCMGGIEAVKEEGESTSPSSHHEADELSSSGESESSATLVELPTLENVAPTPVVRGVVQSPRCNHLSPYVLVPATCYHSSSCVVHAALSKHAMDLGLGATPDRTQQHTPVRG